MAQGFWFTTCPGRAWHPTEGPERNTAVVRRVCMGLHVRSSEGWVGVEGGTTLTLANMVSVSPKPSRTSTVASKDIGDPKNQKPRQILNIQPLNRRV